MSDTRTYAMLIKPVADQCNLSCEYCYYAEKNKLLHTRISRMDQEILESYIKQCFEIHGKDAVVEFAWHGGEPVLAGVDFFKTAIELQKKYGTGRKVLNTIQTNATCLTDEMCQLFREHQFLVGVSIDGPEELHNVYRKTIKGKGSFEQTMNGIQLLKDYQIPFNTLTTVNRINMARSWEVYEFLRDLTDYMQFLPVVECFPAEYEKNEGQKFAIPQGIHAYKIKHPLMPFSVTPEGYGRFLCEIFDCWYKKDVGRKHVQLIDVTLGNIKGVPSSLCVHNPLCGHSGCVEANGDVYACDRYVFPQYKLGNIMEIPLEVLMEKNRRFGMYKTYGLSKDCFKCPYIKMCFGGCPKDRLLDHKNYLCQGYKMFFKKVIESIEMC